MFRKPREADPDTNATPLGRPPTPPGSPAKTPFTLAVPPSVPAPKMAASKSKKPKQVPLPVIGRQGPSPSSKKGTPAAKAKLSGKGNGSILTFFKKAEDGGSEADGLFLKDRSNGRNHSDAENRSPTPAESANGDEEVGEQDRYNESGGSVKRRKTSLYEERNAGSDTEGHHVNGNSAMATPGFAKSGPFMEASDSEDEEDEQPAAIIPVAGPQGDEEKEAAVKREPTDDPHETTPARPPLIKEEPSYGGQDFDDFAEYGDEFDEDLFEEGDEYVERRYMEEQAQLEAEAAKAVQEAQSNPTEQAAPSVGDSTCPICEGSMAGLSEQEAGVHVNHCLDGNPTPLPKPKIKQESASTPPPKAGPQFKRPARPPKPGQANPFLMGDGASNGGGSAFTKLMSSHAEDAAWAEAAAEEHASRGKFAYQRTCPFYKIMPGLFICVDAFRYGAVSGCQAYFLSHFHSDHYVGLTSNWTHGPIYCSKVTANLVRQQLRVDPKYVVDLEFEQTVDVPNTKGVKVTMISANHCPGSSLFLFEKTMGKKSNGEPRLQRILHCGDFRACRAHVEHPLLMPNVQDKISGKTKEQKIDVCYLDTTYLNPKYAFPSQERVITACADMCVSLNRHTVDESDGWEQMKRQRAGDGMVKFIRKESSSGIKEEPEDEDAKDDMKIEQNPHASQQIISSTSSKQNRGRLLVIVGTYSIGKERICLGIAKALKSKIYAPPGKQRIVAALEDPELNERMTTDPRAAQVHMTPLFEIRAETLDDYLKDYFPHFSRAVGFRPSGWNYRPPNTRFLESPSVQTVLNGDNWKSNYSMKELVPQRGSTSRASCFAVPYSEHSSFRELTMFCCSLRIEKIIPTVNVGNAKSRQRMKAWCERWAQERKKNGVWTLPEDGSW